MGFDFYFDTKLLRLISKEKGLKLFNFYAKILDNYLLTINYFFAF